MKQYFPFHRQRKSNATQPQNIEIKVLPSNDGTFVCVNI